MCQFEERLRRLIDTHLAKMCGNFLCVCVRVCVCMGVRGCLKEKRMLMSIAERLSPFFSQWTGCSQGKRKTHEASCPLPTGNVPACTLARARGHTRTHATPSIAPSFLHSPLSSFSLSCFKNCWTGLGLCWFL